MSEQKIIVESTEEEGENAPNVGSFLWELARVVIIAFVVMIGFRFFIAEPFIVSGSSMVPNFHNREYLVVNKLGYHFNQPQRGDVVVFHYPKDPSQYFIKRIIGLPGEKVRIKDGKVVVFNKENPDGAILQEPYLPNQNETFSNDPEKLETLGDREYFVLGDNRSHSSDSRVWGVLPADDLVGKAWLRVFPLNSFGLTKFPDSSLNQATK